MSRVKPGRLKVEALEDRAVPAAYLPDPSFATAQVGTAYSFLESSVNVVQQVVPLADGGALVVTLASAFLPTVSPTLTRLDAAGQIVRSFGTDGRAVAPLATPYREDGVAVAVQADGKILVGATELVNRTDDTGDNFSRMFTVARLTADGRPDESFGPGGVRTPTAGTLSSIVVQPDGKILLGGTVVRNPATEATFIPNDTDFVVARLTADGELDPAFGTGTPGVATIAPAVDKVDELRDMVLLPDGRIVVAGESTVRSDALPNPARLSVARLTADGRPDESFGTGGSVGFNFGPEFLFSVDFAGLAARPDGRVIVGVAVTPFAQIVPLGGKGGPRLEVFQLTDAGTPDTTFGPDGTGRFVSDPLEQFGINFALDAAGRAVILVDSNGPTVPAQIGRLAADGSGLETSFEPLVLPAGAELQQPEVFLDAAGRLTVGIVGPREPSEPADPDAPFEPAVVSPVRVARFVPSAADEPEVPDGPKGPRVSVPAGRFATDGPAAGRATTLPGAGYRVAGSLPGEPGRVTFGSIRDNPRTARVFEFAPFEEAFTGGVFVDAADFNRDGFADLIVTAGDGGGAVVAVYDGAKVATGGVGEEDLLVRFLGIPDAAFRGGTRLAVGDVTGDGVPDLTVAAGVGGGPRVTVWDGASIAAGAPAVRADFFAFEDTVRTGATVAVGDTDGDGVADLLVGAGPGGGPRVREFDGAALFGGGARFGNLDFAPVGSQRRDEFIGDAAGRGGVPVRFVPITTAAASPADPLAIDPAAV